MLLFGQAEKRAVYGIVLGEDGAPLVGAYLYLMADSALLAEGFADVDGSFRIATNHAAPCDLVVSYTGYSDWIKRIDLAKGDVVLDSLTLVEIPFSWAPTIYVIDKGLGTYNDLDKLNGLVQNITIDEVRKLPATFFDPARLAQSFAGVANNNDQANGISIRGNNPDYFKWFLEGVEIVNPNHTSNAGTVSDRPSQNAGGVNILSAQLLSQSQFYKSIYPADFQNALGGIMGMSLRNGDRKEQKHFLQLGLIGLEASSEGPLGKGKNKGSYLFNYRYSTVGLLSQLGLDFGGEKIDFQDLAFNFSLPIEKGMLKVFAVGGLSNNVFTAPEKDEDRMEQKDNTNIDFSGDMGLVGFNFDTYIGENNRLNISSIYSANDIVRTSTNVAMPDMRLSDDIDRTNMLSTKLSIRKLIKKGSWVNGAYHTWQSYTVRSTGNSFGNSVWAEGTQNRMGLFTELHTSLLDTWDVQVGLNAGVQTRSTNNAEWLIEPRASLSRRFNGGHRIYLTTAVYSQSHAPRLYHLTKELIPDVRNARSWQNSIAYVFERPKYEWRVEAFYQYLYNVPVAEEASLSNFSILNGVDGAVIGNLSNNGAGKNIGAEASFSSRANDKGWLWKANATLYQAQYRTSAGAWRSSRFDGRYILNALLGKEWSKKEGKAHGVHARLNVLGGFRRTPIDLSASQAEGRSVYLDELAFTEKQQDYIRTDLSIFRKVERKKMTSTISLDIQNLLNRKNDAFSVYDSFLDQVVQKKQLGLLPILNYRIQF